MNLKKNLKKLVLITLLPLCIYSCQKEKLNKKSSISFLSAGVRDSFNNIEIFSFDNNGSASKLWSYNLRSNNLDSFFNAVQIKTDQIVLFVDSAGGHSQAIAYFGIFDKYSGKTIQKFRPTKNYNIIGISGQPINNTNDGNIYFWGYGKKSKINDYTNGIFKLNLSNDEISIIDSNYFYSTLDSKNNILYAFNGTNKILKLNLSTNTKEEFTMLENLGIMAFLHFDIGLNKLLIGQFPFPKSNLYEVDLSTKKFILIKEKLQFKHQGNFVDISEGQYSEFYNENTISTYNFKNETSDTLNVLGWGASKFYIVNYFGVCK